MKNDSTKGQFIISENINMLYFLQTIYIMFSHIAL